MARGRRDLTLLAMCIAQAMIVLDIMIVNVALPSVQRDLGMSSDLLEWVISAYALTLATFIPLGGSLGDRIGRKRLFLLGLAVFTLSSAGCALSWTAAMLIGFRVPQGVGGAVISALTLSIITEAYPGKSRTGAIGIWAASSGLGFAAGPTVGGLLLSFANWSSVFWVNVPIGLVGLVIGSRNVTESRDPSGRPLDLPGAVLSALGLFGVTLGLTEASARGWASPLVVGSLVGGGAALAIFIAAERHSDRPMVPRSLVADRAFCWSCVAFGLAYGAFTGLMFYVTLLFQDVMGWSALRTGLSWLVINVPYLIVAQMSGRLHRHIASRILMTLGLGVAAVGTLALSQVTTTSRFALAAAGYALVGLGFGLFAPAVATSAMRSVPQGISGIASGLLNAGRQIGTSMGLAVVGTVGTAAALAAWSRATAGLPAGLQKSAAGLGQSVAGGQTSQLANQLGASTQALASSSFVHGFELALISAAALLVVAAMAVFVGLREGAARLIRIQADRSTGRRGVGFHAT